MKKTSLLASAIILGLLLFGHCSWADVVALNPDHPDRHVVVKGDTLWDISAKFLQDPWQWPNIWRINPAIKNPHLIYPGDIILLKFVDGQPVLELMRADESTGSAPTVTETENAIAEVLSETVGGRPIVKLHPKIRASRHEEKPIPVIPSDAIKQFLKYPRIVSKRELEDAGYVVASEDGGLISGTDDKIYARNILQSDQTGYDIVRQGKIYRAKGIAGEILGYEMLRIADARITRFDDPATMMITAANREVLIGDRIMPATYEKELTPNYLPHAPDKPVKGQIIAVLDGVSRIGQFHTVVIDLGARDMMEQGHVLAIYQAGNEVRDTVTGFFSKTIKLPDERAGTLMVIQAFERMSYALVMNADRDMKIFDTVTNP